MKIFVQPSDGFNNFCAVKDDSIALMVVVPTEQILFPCFFALLTILQAVFIYLVIFSIHFMFAKVFYFNRPESSKTSMQSNFSKTNSFNLADV